MARLAPFDSIHSHGFLRIAACVPCVALGDPLTNAERTIALAARAQEGGATLAVFPELGLSGYSIEDLAQQDALLDGVEEAVLRLVTASTELAGVMVVGAPCRSEAKLFNCALIIHRGRLHGVVPKTYLPNYREFYEKRQYASGELALADSIRIATWRAPFGADLLFVMASPANLVLHVELCEDLWVPIPPSSLAALAGATILVNQSASNATIGKAEFRRLLCKSQSARSVAAYAYCAAGYGESTTDLAWDGHALICENGEIIAESRRFEPKDQLITADIDLERLRQERTRLTSFADCARTHREALLRLRRIDLPLEPPAQPVALRRRIPRYPFVPDESTAIQERCEEAYLIQTQGLMRRLQATALEKVVIGASGGLDSTQALLVSIRALQLLQLPRRNILAFSLPGFATSERTRTITHELLHGLGVDAHEIDIRPSATQMLHDIGHPAASGAPQYDITFENVQAGERASHLFRLANWHRAILVGTSDLSELALGYTTYGVGDHMSHYAVNASVPKSLMRHLVGWTLESGTFDPATRRLLAQIVEANSSAELVPEPAEAGGAESTIGPYDLHDFFLYYLTRLGFRPSKIAFLAHHAWSSREDWPAWVAPARRRTYTLAELKHWLGVFLRRFIETSQFKRSALPNGPKVGSGGALSPRADWRAPSDITADTWLRELSMNVPETLDP